MKIGGYCVCLAVGLSVIGCVSINSKAPEDRLSAVADLTTQEELFVAVRDTSYEDVRIAAVKRITDQQSLTTIVATPRFSEEVKCIALSSITNQEYLADVVVADTSAKQHAEVAAHGILNASLLCKCAKETRFESVAEACVGKLDDETLLKQVALGCKSGTRCREQSLAKIQDETVLCDIVLSCSEGWVQNVVIPRLTASASACRMIVAPNISDELRMMLADRIADESFLVAYVKNRQYPDLVRKKCLDKISSESSFASLLKQTPMLEDWVVSYSILHVAESTILVDTVLNCGCSESNRVLAFSKLSRPIEFERLFEEACDDLPIRQTIKRLSANYVLSHLGQEFTVKNFRIAKDDLLRSALLLLMQDETLMGLYRRSDQVKIARAIVVLPSDEMLDMARRSLFDDDVILGLALGKFCKDDKITYWALDLSPNDSVLAEIALKSKSLFTQCRALIRISDETMLSRIALHAQKQAVRMAALAKLTKNSEQVLNELAVDEDAVVKMAAIERLKVLGGANVEELERCAEMERHQKAAQERKLAEEQKARDDQEKKDFEMRYLSVAGATQLSIIRKYIELNSKTHIDSPAFRVTGRVAQFTKRELVLTVYCDDGEAKIAVELSRKSKENFSKDEIVTIVGYNDESTPDAISLRCGDLLERGCGLE